jgi:hypothetical protein
MRRIAIIGLLLPWSQPTAAQGRMLEACARGNLQVCSALLNRPRLEPGRREAIQLHLAEMDKLIVACANGEPAACAILERQHPALPADITGLRR